MRLDDYRGLLEEISGSKLASAEKDAAFDLVASEIEGAAWQPHARAEARRLAAHARYKMCSPTTDEGMRGLARRGLLRERRA